MADLTRARDFLDQALPLARRGGNRAYLCDTLIQLGDLAVKENRWDDAKKCLDEVESINRLLGSRDVEAQHLVVSGRMFRDQGLPDMARQRFELAHTMYERINVQYRARSVQSELDALA